MQVKSKIKGSKSNRICSILQAGMEPKDAESFILFRGAPTRDVHEKHEAYQLHSSRWLSRKCRKNRKWMRIQGACWIASACLQESQAGQERTFVAPLLLRQWLGDVSLVSIAHFKGLSCIHLLNYRDPCKHPQKVLCPIVSHLLSSYNKIYQAAAQDRPWWSHWLTPNHILLIFSLMVSLCQPLLL